MSANDRVDVASPEKSILKLHSTRDTRRTRERGWILDIDQATRLIWPLECMIDHAFNYCITQMLVALML